MKQRRDFLKAAGAAGAGLTLPVWAQAAGLFDIPTPQLPSGDVAESVLHALPGKKPLIKRTYRPANYETPVEYFNEALTPNDAFFVRWHLADIPQAPDEKSWKLKIGGDAANTPAEFSMQDLKTQFEQVELVALCLCSGNRRGFFEPHVPGVEWSYGAMGNARWKGVRLKDVLAKAGVKKEAIEVSLNGADKGSLDKTPDFIKSLPVWKALDDSTILAWEMNGQPLPVHNGYPLRLVVPGWTATYWVKMIDEIQVVSKPWSGFWMNPAYRVPLGKFPAIDRFVSQETPGGTNTPITSIVVNSMFTNIQPGAKLAIGRTHVLKGIAWDDGRGIVLVEVSEDGGRSWRDAKLEKDLGKYSWRQFSYPYTPRKRGAASVMARATNAAGNTQTFSLIWNPAGYNHNVVQKVDLHIA
ncbi:sulfoxide reductase catalytic subunit YedY [mine drainage metagenome]|uniref:Sulfoxide reductase catalytic subunit YedY n=1 Tax=mine drainage metagenome TaxID=410659 RepID=A0A1J5RQA3_9ZZZZ